MCTVSFVALEDTVILTSNRDENIERQTAAAPAFYVFGTKKIIFPKDSKAGGTWFAASDEPTVAVLLNGAFAKHVANPPYRKSRGLILLEFIEAEKPLVFFDDLDLRNIEPFTIVFYEPGSLRELRWDGSKKYKKELTTSGNYIWSSATLYSDEIIAKRKRLFEEFINSNEEITAEAISDFHGHNHGDSENGFVISRDTGIKTFSITQAIVEPTTIHFLHNDLLQHSIHTETLPIKQATIRV